MTEDPERLVAEALRAHAARTPLPSTPPDPPSATSPVGQPTDQPASPPSTEPPGDASPVLGSYGLLSGSGVTLGDAEPTTARAVPTAGTTTRFDQGEDTQEKVAAGWILLLAVLLGLAAGAVVGLLTLL